MIIKRLVTAFTLLAPLPALADTVNIYSYRQPFLLEPILEKFTADTGIETQVVFAKSGLIERLASEGQYSPADLVLTSDFSNLIKAAAYGQPVTTDALAGIIPAAARDPEGQWFGLTWRARIAFVSRERVGNEVDTLTYAELAHEKWRGRICMRDGQHPYNIALFAALIAHYGVDWTRDWLIALRSNLAVKPSGNDRAQVRNVYAGICDLAIGNTYYMGAMETNDQEPEQKLWAQAVRLIFPTMENGQVHANISGMVLTKHAPNRAAALRLMTYLASDAAQEEYAAANFEYPVKLGVKIPSRVAKWGTFNPDTMPLSEINSHIQTASRLVDEVSFNSGP